jgi:hypothetical protein
MGSTPTPFTTMNKPGGTMVLSAGNITGRVIASDMDQWGRWTSQTYRSLNQLRITIISAYQVGQDVPEKGTVTAATQQRSLLLLANDPVSDPRIAFKRDLSSYIQACRSKGDELILVGDFNEQLGRNSNGIESMAGEYGLLNMMSARHGDLQPPATYARGRNCIDYGFATLRVIQALSKCGYEQFNVRFSTDHRACFFDFDTEKLFGRQTPELASTAQRILNSANVKQVTNYFKIKYDYLKQCNAFERVERLTFPGDRHQYAKRLDKDMVQASLVAENRTKRFGAPEWSIALGQARKRVNILKKCLSMARTQLDMNETVQTNNDALNEPMDLPRTKRECCTLLRAARRAVKEIVAASYQQRDRERQQRILQLEMSGMARDATHARLLRRLQKGKN